jgi:hypothetical protein
MSMKTVSTIGFERRFNPALKARGKDILTIEGLKSENGELHVLQKAFMKHFAIQCGYCTPGMILAAKALLDENPHPTVEEVDRMIITGSIRGTEPPNLPISLVMGLILSGSSWASTPVSLAASFSSWFVTGFFPSAGAISIGEGV